MGLSTKASPAAAKQKKPTKTNVVILRLPPKFLSKLSPSVSIKKDHESKAPSSTASNNTLVATTSSPGENTFDSKSNTPAPSVADGSTSMPPPTEGVKKNVKQGVKRSLPAADGLLKPRGKPGPKKKTKLDDGATDNQTGTTKNPYSTATTGTHKLGPKANQGAINAGLRALDRSGKPCRKWQKSSFKIRSFTGTEWEIPRWSAPPKVTFKGDADESGSTSSSKENKESTHVDSEKSNSAMDIEMGSAASMAASSPAPIVIASA